MIEAEIWRPCAGFEATHEVSSLGRLRRTGPIRTRWGNYAVRTPERCLRTCLSKQGYPYFHIRSEALGKKRKAYAHSLVAATFIGPRPEGLQCAHLNGVRTDPRLSNLAYVTAKENTAHKLLHGTDARTIAKRGEETRNARLTDAAVRAIRKAWEAGGTNFCALGRAYGVSGETIRCAVRRISWSHI